MNVTECVDCGHPMAYRASVADGLRQSQGRGLCANCYQHHRRHVGDLCDFPRATRTREETLAEWELLRSEGYTRRQIAERLGIKDDSLYQALRRAGVA